MPSMSWVLMFKPEPDLACFMLVRWYSYTRSFECLSCASMVRFSCNIVVEYQMYHRPAVQIRMNVRSSL